MNNQGRHNVRRTAEPHKKSWISRLPLLLFIATISLIVLNKTWPKIQDYLLLSNVQRTAVQVDPVILGSLPDSLPLWAVDLDSLRQVPELREDATIVGTHLSTYRQQLHELPVLATGKHLDIILQAHEDPADGFALNPIVIRSKHAIELLLNARRPEVVGNEGQDCDTLNESAMFRMVVQYATQHKIPIDRFSVYRSIQEEQDIDPVLRYGKSHPAARLIGYEDQTLNTLHFDNITWSDEHGPWAEPPHLMTALREMRSLVGLHRMLATMDREHRTHGAMVIGYMHGPELQQLCETIGLQATIYSTVQ